MNFLKKIDNMSMLFDFYELTMGNGYFEKGLSKNSDILR